MDQCFLILPTCRSLILSDVQWILITNEWFIDTTNKYLLIQNIDEPMSTWNFDSKWITFDRLGKSQRGGGSDVCVLSEEIRVESTVKRGVSLVMRRCCALFVLYCLRFLSACCPLCLSSIILLYSESLTLDLTFGTRLNTFNSHPSVPKVKFKTHIFTTCKSLHISKCLCILVYF